AFFAASITCARESRAAPAPGATVLLRVMPSGAVVVVVAGVVAAVAAVARPVMRVHNVARLLPLRGPPPLLFTGMSRFSASVLHRLLGHLSDDPSGGHGGPRYLTCPCACPCACPICDVIGLRTRSRSGPHRSSAAQAPPT